MILNKFRFFAFFLFWVVTITNLCAQNYCGTDDIFHQLDIKESTIEKYHRRLKEIQGTNVLHGRGEELYIIPVVFHIIHKGGVENVSDDQVYDQMRIINEDFRMQNAKIEEVVEPFKALAADCNIEFRLAKLDPNGNCTNGIIRHYDERTYASDLHDADSLKIGRQWPREKYLNIYVLGSIQTSGGGTTLGFAYYPITVDTSQQYLDGIMQVYSSVGSFGTSSDRYSGVLTHEIGHYLHLHHTWGQGTAGTQEACNEDDDVEDTPNTRGNPSVCNLSAESCGSLDNVQNFMDYSFCYAMLTGGQRDRMIAVLNDTVAERNKLWTQENLLSTGASDAFLGELCYAGYRAKEDHKCVGDTFTLQDLSYHRIDNWQWYASGFPTINNQGKTATIVFDSAGVFNTALSVANNTDSFLVYKLNHLFVHPPNGNHQLPYLEDFKNVSDLTDLIWDGKLNDSIGFAISNVGKDDNSSIMLNNYLVNGRETIQLETSTFHLDGYYNQVLTMDVSFAPKQSSNSNFFTLYYAKDCSNEWVKIKRFLSSTFQTANVVSNEPFIPNANQWRKLTIELPEGIQSAATRFKIEYTTEGGNQFYMDNLQIVGTSTSHIIDQHTNEHIWIMQEGSWVCQNNTTVQEVIVYDLMGKPVYKNNITNTIPTTLIANGVYVVTWKANGMLRQQKLIKY